MVRKVKSASEEPLTAVVSDITGLRPRLVKLIIKNFRCIGNTPVTIDLDDIVVLVGPNNAGKSSILYAYEVIMSEGSDEGKISIEDFPLGKIDPNALPEIELHTVVYDNSPGDKWINLTTSNEKLVKEKWYWKQPGPPIRIGYNTEKGDWAAETDKEKVPWGAPGVSNSRRPQAHLIRAFDPPEKQAEEIIKILMTVIKEKVKSYKKDSISDNESDYSKLLNNIGILQKKIVYESQDQINSVQIELSNNITKVFPGHCVRFDAKPEDDIDKTITLFKSNPQLLMGPESGYMSSINRQGSGAQRTLLWAAIKYLAENGNERSSQRPHVLLLDEPEICLHPSAVRGACDLLYGLPENSYNWQVMLTTHSPCFIDFSRDHTSIIRVERRDDGVITGTTIFRPSSANFDESDRENLKLLNQCDPYVAEFFFGGKSIIVEGDTEYTAFKYIINLYPDKYKDIHIIRARGKATIVSLCKILNQFGSAYSVLHDSDYPTCKRNGSEIANPAWALNETIVGTFHQSKGSRLLASLPNFEKAYLGKGVESDKPYNILFNLRMNTDVVDKITQLLDALSNIKKTVPEGAMEWSDINTLKDKIGRI